MLMNTIYHYTDLNGFLNILKNKKLWLSATNNLNDYYEVDWILHKLQQRLFNKTNEDKLELINIFWEMRSRNMGIPYICSFSKNGDILSQWRAYADDGHGVAIGFNRSYFDFKVDFPTHHTSSEYTIGINDVVYDDSNQNIIVDNIAKLVLSAKNIEEGGKNLLSAMELSRRAAYICKNPAFREEDEVRIIHTPMIMGNQEGQTPIYGNISDMKHRVTGKSITSYFELDFSVSKDVNPVAEIILGPKSKLSRYDIETFLSLNGLENVPYTWSTASYR